MGVFYGPKNAINKTGLILNLDASSYPGSGSTWTDTSSSGYIGTISGATYAAGPPASFSFNGSSSYVLTNVNNTLTAATFLCWIKSSGGQSAWAGLMYNRSTVICGFHYNGSGTGLAYTWENSSSTYNFASGITITTGVWCQVAVSISATSATFYLNNTPGNTNTLAHNSQTVNSLYVGQDTLGGRFFNGNIGVAMLYNRALPSTEISQNFNALRGRFGI